MDTIVKGKIANALTSAAMDHVVATTNDLYDEKLEMYQEDINDLNHGGIEELKVQLSASTKEIIKTITASTKTLEDKIDSGVTDIKIEVNTIKGVVYEIESSVTEATEIIIEKLDEISEDIQETCGGIKEQVSASTTTIIENISASTSEIKTKIDNIDLSIVAKEGENSGATNTAILQAIVNLDNKIQEATDAEIDNIINNLTV